MVKNFEMFPELRIKYIGTSHSDETKNKLFR